MTYTIREMQSIDFARVKQIDRRTQEQYLGNKWNRMNEDERKTHVVSEMPGFGDIVRGGYCFTALEKDRVVGFLVAYSTFPFENKNIIKYIAVDPILHGKQIGMLLYKKLIEKAQTDTVQEINALINLDNTKSLRLHEKMGFNLKDRKQAVLKL